MWYYNSKVGDMYIRRNAAGRYTLYIDGEPFPGYNTPDSAADDVYTFSTGYTEWDLLGIKGNLFPPDGLDCWQFLPDKPFPPK